MTESTYLNNEQSSLMKSMLLVRKNIDKRKHFIFLNFKNTKERLSL